MCRCEDPVDVIVEIVDAAFARAEDQILRDQSRMADGVLGELQRRHCDGISQEPD